jgi:hypothetical protein
VSSLKYSKENIVATKYEKVRNWLLEEYKNVQIEGLQIDTVMCVLEDTLKEIAQKEMYDVRLPMSKNLSVLLYKSGTFEVHISIPKVLSTYNDFKGGI